MKCYSVSAFYSSSHSIKSDSQALWEEVLFFIKANSEKEAENLAIKIAKDRETAYETEHGNLVAWKFEKIERVFLLENISAEVGTELFSRFLTAKEAQSILSKIN